MNLKLLLTCFFFFLFYVSTAQVANQPTDYRLCEIENEDYVEFDLNIKDSEILQGQDPSIFAVTYHMSQFEAESGNSALSSPYTNATNPQIIWVRVEDTSTGNFDTTFFNLIVIDAPTIPDIGLYICDEDGDGEVQLNFATSENGYSLSYHLTVNDAEQNINALTFPVTYQAENIPSHVYARSENSEGCFYVVYRALYYGTGIVANSLTPLEACGNNGIAQFYLPYKNDEVTGGLPLTVRYYLTENDAQNGSGFLPSTYTNISNPQTIYARVYNIACYDVTPLELIANEGATLNLTNVSSQITCDWTLPYDVTQFEGELLQNEDPTNLVTSYYTSLGDLYSDTNQISNPTQFILSAPDDNETIYIRVDNIVTGCYDFKSFNLKGKEEFELNSITLTACDINNDGLEVFNLQDNYSEILNGSGVNLRLYETEVDAINDVNYIWPPNAYESGNATIYVRGYYNDTDCFEIVPIYLEIETGPELANVIYSVCDINSNGFETVELIEMESFVLSNLDSGLSYDISFFETESDAVFDIFPINDQIDVFTNGNTVFTRITNIESDDCSNVQAINLELISVPTFTDFLSLVACDDDNDGFAEFDFTPNLNLILSELPGVDVTFHSTFANASSDTDALPLIYLTNNDQIFVRVLDPTVSCYNIFVLPLQYFCDEPIDCNSGAVNNTFCYVDDETLIYPYSSSNGLPLTVVFNSGQVENNYDSLIVLDSDGVTNLNASTPYGNNGDVSGLVFTSSGSEITIKVDSDNIFSCQTEGYLPIDYDVFCSSNVGIIEVNAFIDDNANSIFDTNEFSFTNGYFTYEANGDGMINIVNSSTGSFSIISENDTDVYEVTFNLYDEFADCYDITTAVFNSISVAEGTSISVDFPVVEEQSCEDLSVYLINYWTPPRPGFSHENQIIIENFGFTTIVSGTVEFTYDPLLVYNGVTSVNPNYTITTTATGFTVDFVNLQPGGVEYIDVSLTCPAEIELGDILTNTATYLTDTNDLVSTNNYSTLSEVVVASWDPNDMRESHGPRVNYDNFAASDEYLYYTIRFQNLGTVAADFVRIEDALDSQLDETSFQMLRSSHDYVVTRTDTDLEWFFEDINLAAEQDDIEASQGFVYFKIKPKSGYAIGDIIPNTASIFFDFNAPVITNLFDSEFVEDALSVEDSNFIFFDMFPNPANDLVTIRLSANNSGNVTVNIIDLQGKLILEQHISEGNTMELDITDLQSGLYFVKLNANNKSLVKKLIIE